MFMSCFMVINGGSCSTNMCARQLSFNFSSMGWGAMAPWPPLDPPLNLCIDCTIRQNTVGLLNFIFRQTMNKEHIKLDTWQSPAWARPAPASPTLTKLLGSASIIGAIWRIWLNRNVSQMWACCSSCAQTIGGGQKLDRSKTQFLHTPPAFGAPVQLRVISSKFRRDLLRH